LKYRSVCLRTPNQHNSDHCAIITIIFARSAMKTAAYCKQMAEFPRIKLPPGPQDVLSAIFEELQLNVVAPPKQTQPHNSWISAPTWALINKRAMLRQ
jgi:hypothetical protein